MWCCTIDNIIIETVDSISRDERDVPLTQYITNAGISEGSWANCQDEEMPVWDGPVRIPGARRGRGVRSSGDIESGSSSGTADPTDKEGSARHSWA